LLSHPDHPQRFVEWSDYAVVVSRANEFLGQGNRFAATPLPRRGELDLLKRVRNAVAHRTDRAWERFLNVCRGNTFLITLAGMRGITPGRFLATHQWNGQPVLREAISLLEAAARHLAP
jgi:predicted YcjX-like family ATPase